MRRAAPLLIGIALGLGAIVLAWTSRLPRDVRPGAGRPPASPAAATRPVPGVSPRDLETLWARSLAVPVLGLAADELRDSFAESRRDHTHEAIDIFAPRGTPVVAADDGQIAKLLTSVRGGLTIYEFDPSSTYCYYYAHLDAYALGILEGATVRKGKTIGYVGTTGNAPPRTPHLHFAVFKLGPEKRWWKGTAINPFTLWTRPKVD
jgi:murein DD-endopeptidase MepM/ murein hydrolase activator NlpD